MSFVWKTIRIAKPQQKGKNGLSSMKGGFRLAYLLILSLDVKQVYISCDWALFESITRLVYQVFQIEGDRYVY